MGLSGIYIKTHIYIYIYLCVCIYIYLFFDRGRDTETERQQRDRETERERERERETSNMQQGALLAAHLASAMTKHNIAFYRNGSLSERSCGWVVSCIFPRSWEFSNHRCCVCAQAKSRVWPSQQRNKSFAESLKTSADLDRSPEVLLSTHNSACKDPCGNLLQFSRINNNPPLAKPGVQASKWSEGIEAVPPSCQHPANGT